MGNFELFMGYLGNGCTLANKSVYENGDYKTIGHISNAGNIKLYVNPEYIPENAMNVIKATADNHKNKTISYLDSMLNHDYGYCRILDEICDYTPFNTWNTLLNEIRDKSNEEKVKLIKECYLANF